MYILLPFIIILPVCRSALMPRPMMYVRPRGFFPISFKDLVNDVARRNSEANRKIVIVVSSDALNESDDLKYIIKLISKYRNLKEASKNDYYYSLTKTILYDKTPADLIEQENNYRNGDNIMRQLEKSENARRKDLFAKIMKDDNQKSALRLTLQELLGTYHTVTTEKDYITLDDVLNAKEKKPLDQPTVLPQTEFNK